MTNITWISFDKRIKLIFFVLISLLGIDQKFIIFNIPTMSFVLNRAHTFSQEFTELVPVLTSAVGDLSQKD